jgi:acetate kinase
MGIDAVHELLPEMKQVTAFDTAIFQAMPPQSYLYGLPREQYTKYKIRRYGAHGLSHGYVAQQTAETLGRPLKDLKVIVCHLGNGASISAFKDGSALDTSMGLTPLAGVLMGTRTGDMDPYIPLHIMQTQGLSAEQVNTMMNKQSGLFGLCGHSDMRDISKGIAAGDQNCAEALDIFVYRIQKYIGAYIAAMDGVDVITFTAGIGENCRFVRSKVLKNFSYMGVFCDDRANEAQETVISTADSKVKALVIHTDEELVIAKDTYTLVTGKTV